MMTNTKLLSACDLLIYRTYTETWRKGERYANDKRIIVKEYDDKFVDAIVQGTKPYEVKLSFRGSGISRSCSCPVNDFCKHIVAVAICWDELRGISRPSKDMVEKETIPPPLISRSDIDKAYENPLSADLEIIRLASSESGNWSRPHARLPQMPRIFKNLEKPITLELVKKAWGEIRSWERRSSYDYYFCAGEIVAAFCEVMRSVILKVREIPPIVLTQMLRESQKFHYEIIQEMIDDSDGLHIFTEAHLDKLYLEIKKLKKGNGFSKEVSNLLAEFSHHRNDY